MLGQEWRETRPSETQTNTQAARLTRDPIYRTGASDNQLVGRNTWGSGEKFHKQGRIEDCVRSTESPDEPRDEASGASRCRGVLLTTTQPLVLSWGDKPPVSYPHGSHTYSKTTVYHNLRHSGRGRVYVPVVVSIRLTSSQLFV